MSKYGTYKQENTGTVDVICGCNLKPFAWLTNKLEATFWLVGSDLVGK